MRKHSKQNRLDLEQIYGNNKIVCHNKIILGEKFYSMFLTFFIFSIPYILSIIFFLKSGGYATSPKCNRFPFKS